MKIINLVPNTPEWLAYRSNPEIYNASEAPAMMNCSPYMSRRDLIKLYSTGIKEDISDGTQKRFNDGHKFEALAKPLAEEIIGEDLAAIVGADGSLSASFDGITFGHDIIWEHKTLNDSIREVITKPGHCFGKLPLHYRVQMEQQLAISKASKCLFMGSKWKWENGEYVLEEMLWCWYEPDLALRDRIILGWDQFAIDVKNYKPIEVDVSVGRTPESLPALTVSLAGIVQASNLEEFKAGAIEIMSSIKTDLVTDQDFADADKAIKWLKNVEENIEVKKAELLSGMADVDAIFKTLDYVKDQLARVKRLEMEKIVKSRHEKKMAELLSVSREAVDAVIDEINEKLKHNLFAVSLNLPAPDFISIVKGKKSWATREAACHDAISQFKIDAAVKFAHLESNLAVLAEIGSDYPGIWHDAQMLIEKPSADLAIIAKARIDQHTAAMELAAKNKIAQQKKDLELVGLEPEYPAGSEQYREPEQADCKSEAGTAVYKYTRPSDDLIINAVAIHFNVAHEVAMKWVSEVAINKVN